MRRKASSSSNFEIHFPSPAPLFYSFSFYWYLKAFAGRSLWIWDWRCEDLRERNQQKKRFSVSFLCSLPIYKKFVVRNPPDVPIYFSLIFWKIAVLIHRCILLWLVDCLFVVFVHASYFVKRTSHRYKLWHGFAHIKTRSMQMPPLSRDCEQRCDLNPRPVDQIMPNHVCVYVLIPVWVLCSFPLISIANIHQKGKHCHLTWWTPTWSLTINRD